MKNIWIMLVGLTALLFCTQQVTAQSCTLAPFTISGVLPTNAANYTFLQQNLGNYNVKFVAGTSWLFQTDSSIAVPQIQAIVDTKGRTITFTASSVSNIKTNASPSLVPSFTVLMSGLVLVFGSNKKYLLFLGLFLCFAASVMAVDACNSIVITYPVPVTIPTNGTNIQPQPSKPPTQAPTQGPPSTQGPTSKPTSTQGPTSKPTSTQGPTPKPTSSPTTQPSPTSPPSGGSCSLGDILTEALYNQMFPNLNYGANHAYANQKPIFNYQYLINAAQAFPTFACDGTVEERTREIAAFLAQTSQESSGWWAGQPYNWGYCYSTEVGCTDATCTQYCDSSNTQYPCQPSQAYYGRGPIQLSWNYNYGQFSQYYYGDKNVLLNNPNMMLNNGTTAFASALWFWMTPQNPKPSCHDVMVGKWVPTSDDTAHHRAPGFGMVTFIINGGIECGHTTPQQVTNRVGYFGAYTTILNVDEGPNVYCDQMTQY